MPAALPLLLVKMAIVAAIVVLASMLAERTRPAIGALIATLPISLGPTYVLLAMDHDAAFVSEAALKSVPGACTTIGFIVVYSHAVMRWPVVPAALAGYGAWLAGAVIVHLVPWTIASATLCAVLTVFFARRATVEFVDYRLPAGAQKRRWDGLLRVLGVVLLVGTVTGLSHVLGASGVGAVANFPIVMSTMGLLMTLRFGPAAAAAVLSNAVYGMAGVATALMVLHLTMVPLGPPLSLVLGLALCVAWNATLYAWMKR